MIVLLVAAPVLLLAVLAAVVVQRRTAPDVPTQPTQYAVPSQLDRSDFDDPGAPWLVAVFSSDTCSSCAATLDKARPLASDDVVVQQVELQQRRDLHDRYAIEAVPMLLVADDDGVVRASFLGTPTAADLWAALAELREPGSVPGGCDRHASAPER
ncbi:MAG: thioredoxin domain-containing protein [Acidimicrobiales bacterium]